MHIEIKEKLEDLLPFLSKVSASADTAKEELGFWPNSAYQTLASSGKLIIAIAIIDGLPVYAGHLMFGGLFPQAKIFQLFVAPEFRRHGIGRQLLDKLKKRLTSEHWLSVVAKVADNLTANSAWNRLGFRIIRTKAGGVSRKRRINVRVLDLETPSLLTMLGTTAKGGQLQFAERYSQRPIYLFDLNVLFDVIRKRPRSDAAAKVVWAGLTNTIRLMVAAEFAKELLRTSKETSNDPVLAFVSHADSLPEPPEKDIRALASKLSPAIFAERHRQGTLTDQDKSDLKHLATAIHHRVAGFITSENAILRARLLLLEQWNLDVIGVEEFAELVKSQREEDGGTAASVSSGTLRIRRNSFSDLSKARVFLESIEAPSAFAAESLACQDSHSNWLLVTDETENPLGFAKWTIYGGTKRTADIYLAVNEVSPNAEPILDHLLSSIPRELSAAGPTLIRLHVIGGQMATRQAALAHGFRPPIGAKEDHLTLQRLALGKLVTPETWQSIRQSLMSAASLSVPLHMPTLKKAEQQVLLKAGEREVALSLPELESELSPVLFLFPGRAGVIVPIRAHFARDLFGADPQFSMLVPPEAILRSERVYVSAPKTVGQMQPGTPVLFYESQKFGGRGCVIAIARITGSRLVTKVDALENVLQRGVLDSRSLEGRSVGRKVAETSFDNIFIFKKPVSLKRLRELGCVDGANLISARAISFENLVEVVKEGRVDG